MDADVLAEAVELTQARRAFALATVVWRRAPTSGHVGSKGVVLDDGTVRGWLGGACAEPTVVREALGVARSTASRGCCSSGSPDELTAHDHDETVTIADGVRERGRDGDLPGAVPPRSRSSWCSGGRRRCTRSRCRRGHCEWDVAVIDDGGRADEHPHPELVRTSLDLSGLGIGPSTAIVVATQGHYDDLALRAALATDAGYIGVVAAEKRASSTARAPARRRRRRRCSSPACTRPPGSTSAPVDNAEIAVAVLADLVARRAAGQLRAVAPVTARREAIDPVCGMTVFVDEAKYHTVHDGTDYWFCASTCLRAFQREPASFGG